ncbi:hypothetical protein [Nakamurella antarctica]|uniref:hypothetical protein n=1 Tax=Nakamurella antarctica TaxID=1902245 RepID=UPI0013DE6E0C|nr:hypothetical protein [Nakamurella antarctica]
MTWEPIVLLGLAGFLAGGSFSLWKTSRIASIVLGVVTVAAAVGGVLWAIR